MFKKKNAVSTIFLTFIFGASGNFFLESTVLSIPIEDLPDSQDSSCSKSFSFSVADDSVPYQNVSPPPFSVNAHFQDSQNKNSSSKSSESSEKSYIFLEEDIKKRRQTIVSRHVSGRFFSFNEGPLEVKNSLENTPAFKAEANFELLVKNKSSNSKLEAIFESSIENSQTKSEYFIENNSLDFQSAKNPECFIENIFPSLQSEKASKCLMKDDKLEEDKYKKSLSPKDFSHAIFPFFENSLKSQLDFKDREKASFTQKNSLQQTKERAIVKSFPVLSLKDYHARAGSTCVVLIRMK
ncbi:hypothetical protein [Holospora undulata]|uniref:Uncharacterized protein n=1 Tax=Holospora undulata HU1 TaxID=1321371 RepID=A0A061JIZ5_9PROT|nr:hypothetical protein [Holospora undulata]ETZ05424.1 hypothetical protein K737_300137 [Holospora undulata HU1]